MLHYYTHFCYILKGHVLYIKLQTGRDRCHNALSRYILITNTLSKQQRSCNWSNSVKMARQLLSGQGISISGYMLHALITH